VIEEATDLQPLPSEAEKKIAQRNISDLASEFVCAGEWGLFVAAGGEKTGPFPTKIVDALERAGEALRVNDMVTLSTCLLEGRMLLTEAQLRGPMWYKANTRFGFAPLAMTTIIGALAYFVLTKLLKLSPPEIFHHSAFLGLAGATLKSLYWSQFQINKGLLRPRWFASFLAAPFVGIILGAISSLIVNVSFKLASGNGQGMPDWRMVGLVAAFAGFNWEWALEKFKIGADAVAVRARKQAP
jgi:hypothetical protein